MLGYLPAPFIYGLVSDLPLGSKERQQQFALASILYMVVGCCIFISSAYAIKYQACCFGRRNKERLKTELTWRGYSDINLD